MMLGAMSHPHPGHYRPRCSAETVLARRRSCCRPATRSSGSNPVAVISRCSSDSLTISHVSASTNPAGREVRVRCRIERDDGRKHWLVAEITSLDGETVHATGKTLYLEIRKK